MIVDESRYESKYYIVNMETGEKTEYNSGLHDNFIRVNTQEKVVKR